MAQKTDNMNDKKNYLSQVKKGNINDINNFINNVSEYKI